MSQATKQPEQTAPKPAPVARKVVGPDRTPIGQEKVPNLFPQWVFFKNQSRQDQFIHLETRLVELADEGSLSVAHLHQQPKPIPDYCGMIILGQEYDSDNKMVQKPYVPSQLADYRVRIVSREREVIKVHSLDPAAKKETTIVKESISWKIGREPAGFHTVSRSGGKGGACQIYRDAYMEFSEPVYDMTFNLPTAWRILHQAGENCVVAKRKDKQERYWKYAEVAPKAWPSNGSDSPLTETTDEPHMRKREGN